MSATEDEAQDLDAGWDDEPSTSSDAPSTPGEEEVDEASVDGGWDDVPEGAPQPAGGKRRPHRQRLPDAFRTRARCRGALARKRIPRPALLIARHDALAAVRAGPPHLQ